MGDSAHGELIVPDFVEFWREWASWLSWLSLGSLAGAAVSVGLTFWLVPRLPADYFSNPRRRAFLDRSPSLLLLAVAKNCVGGVLILAGLAMLVLPGQGLLTLLLGLSLLDVPGKHRWVLRLSARPALRRAIQWLRRRADKPPFEFPGDEGG